MKGKIEHVVVGKALKGTVDNKDWEGQLKARKTCYWKTVCIRMIVILWEP